VTDALLLGLNSAEHSLVILEAGALQAPAAGSTTADSARTAITRRRRRRTARVRRCWTLAGRRAARIRAHRRRQVLRLATLQLLHLLLAEERPVLVHIVPHLATKIVRVVRHGANVHEYVGYLVALPIPYALVLQPRKELGLLESLQGQQMDEAFAYVAPGHIRHLVAARRLVIGTPGGRGVGVGGGKASAWHLVA